MFGRELLALKMELRPKSQKLLSFCIAQTGFINKTLIEPMTGTIDGTMYFTVTCRVCQRRKALLVIWSDLV